MELRLSLDEREDADEEQETEVHGMPFVVSNELLDSYGEFYDVDLNENGLPSVVGHR